MKQEVLEQLKKAYPIGTRVELIRMDDKQAPPEGTRGTVKGVDDIGSLLVEWDNGSSLNVIYGEDLIKTVKEIRFNDDFVKPKINELMNLKIARFYISDEAAEKVKDILCLNNNTEDDLRAKRNSVVKLFSDKANSFLNQDKKDYKSYDLYYFTMSGVVYVIDTILFKMGCEV